MRTFYPSIDELTENTKILMREFLNQEDSIAASEGAIGSSCLRNSPINEIENGGEFKAVNKKESEDQNNTEHNLLGKRKLETEDNNSKIEKENVTSKPDNPIKMLAYSVLFKRRFSFLLISFFFLLFIFQFLVSQLKSIEIQLTSK